jgi:hypothetical protein
MNLFEKSKISQDKGIKKCFFCEKEFTPDKRDLNRGWGLFCSKSCSKKNLNSLFGMSENERKQYSREKKLRQLGI